MIPARNEGTFILCIAYDVTHRVVMESLPMETDKVHRIGILYWDDLAYVGSVILYLAK